MIKCDCNMLTNMLVRFLLQTVLGLRFFFIQLLVWIVLDLLMQFFGLQYYWGRFGILAMALQFCMLVYTLLYSWFYAFVPLKNFLTTAFIPYFIYMLFVYIGIVMEYDWNLKIVSIDEYMLMGWLAPLYGATLYCIKWKCTQLLNSYPKVLKVFRITINSLCIIFFLLIFCVFIKEVYWRFF